MSVAKKEQMFTVNVKQESFWNILPLLMMIYSSHSFIVLNNGTNRQQNQIKNVKKLLLKILIFKAVDIKECVHPKTFSAENQCLARCSVTGWFWYNLWLKSESILILNILLQK